MRDPRVQARDAQPAVLQKGHHSVANVRAPHTGAGFAPSDENFEDLLFSPLSNTQYGVVTIPRTYLS